MSGGKGGSTSQQVTIPDWLQQPAQRNLARAEEAAKVGYMPYYGPDVAAFTPMQQQAMQANVDAASAFGLVPQGTQAMAGMPQAQDFGGVQGYSSGSMFDQALAELASRRPGQYVANASLFRDPITGQTPDQFLSSQNGQSAVGPSIPRMSDGGDGGDPGQVTYDPFNQYMQAQNYIAGRNALNPIVNAILPGAFLSPVLENFVVNPYEEKTGLKFTPYPEGQSNDRGDTGYVTGDYGGESISYGRANDDGTNPTSTVSGGSGRTDGGWGW
jgi:hypothetical protein